jgi:hypothetical protein
MAPGRGRLSLSIRYDILYYRGLAYLVIFVGPFFTYKNTHGSIGVCCEKAINCW